MSDPVSNTEIEDVLSSIRRLVADDPKTPVAQERQADRLVLTPSQRVPDAADTAVREEPDAVGAPDESDRTGPGALAALVEDEVERVLEDVLPNSLGEADADQDDLAESILAEAGPELNDERDAADAASDAVPDTGEETMADSALEQKIAALEQLVTQKGEDWDSDGDGMSEPMFQHNPARALDWKADPDPAALEMSDEMPTESPSQDASDVVEQAPEPAPVLETPVASEAEHRPEPELAPEPAPAREPEVDSTVTPFVLHEAPEAEDVQDSVDLTETEPDLLADNTIALDEEALRDLVGEMVRRELQGALGERITRNVRKLVRREIHRAMVAREFE